MQKKLTIKQVLWRGFGTIFLLIIIANFVANHTKNTLVKSLDNVTLSYKLLQELAELDMLLLEAETCQRGYLYTGKENFLDPYNEANASINVQLAELREKIRNPKKQEKLGELQTLIKERIDYIEKTIQMRKSGREQEVKNIVSAGTKLEIMAKLRGKITEIKETENQFLADRNKLAREAEIFSTYMVYLSQSASQTAGALREINGAISQLNEASQGLRQEISRFKVSSKEA
ncbi:CHASE3 domain-containing protein [Microcoleus sp. A006_D1]|uniref:CHASE3 domain-containing protein n=1 Tax=Microcoleus sp. A006_D1 TaxID=3055267 RepID=UPI002FD026F5